VVLGERRRWPVVGFHGASYREEMGEGRRCGGGYRQSERPFKEGKEADGRERWHTPACEANEVVAVAASLD
jgi:hypothetical protein